MQYGGQNHQYFQAPKYHKTISQQGYEIPRFSILFFRKSIYIRDDNTDPSQVFHAIYHTQIKAIPYTFMTWFLASPVHQQQ